MEHHIADAMARLGRRIEATTDPDAVLAVIVRAAAELMPGVDHASVTLIHRRGQVETAAFSSERAVEFDQFQYDAREGPCLDALDPTKPAVLVATNLRHEQRWPRYVPRASRSGVTAQVAARLNPGGRSRGSLNLYSAGAEEVTGETVQLAELFAVHASLALGRAHTEANLRLALESRSIIGQAIGIIRERYGLTEDHAVAYLTRTSQNTNTKLREIADQIGRSVDDGTGTSDVKRHHLRNGAG